MRPVVLPGIAACLAVALLGSVNLAYPFIGDQAVAMYAARTAAEGGTLYVDFWDNKLPGLIWFHQLAGTLFGFDEVGIHLFELLWMLVFSAVLSGCLWREFSRPWVSAFVPLAVVGTYYVAADPLHLTQLEIVVALPTFLGLWLSFSAPTQGNAATARQFASGLLAGVTVTFKLVLAPIFVFVWLAVAWRRDRGRGRVRELAAVLIPAATGVVVVLGAVVAYFHSCGALSELLWTAFVYPREALDSAPAAKGLRFFRSSMFFAAFFGAWAVFIVVAVLDWYRGREHPLTVYMLIWAAGALFVIWLQSFSWWAYHFQLLFVPAGILGVIGCDSLARRLETGHDRADPAVNAVLLAMLLSPALALAAPVVQKVDAHLEVLYRQKKPIADLQNIINPSYAVIRASVRFLQQDTARPGPIYVFGDPLYIHLSGRRSALNTLGGAWAYYLDSQWQALADQLDEARPAYIYIDRDNRRQMERRGGGVLDFVLAYYVPFTRDRTGTWYQIRPDFVR